MSEKYLKKENKDLTQPRYDFGIRSCWSLNKGIGSIKEVVTQAKKFGIGGICLCDEYSTNGYFDFEKVCKANRVRPFFGTTIRIDRNQRVILVAKNKDGIRNINEVISRAVKDKNGEFSNDLFDIPALNIISIGILDEIEQLDFVSNNFDYIGVYKPMKELLNKEDKIKRRIIAISDSYYVENSDKLLFDVLSIGETKENKRIKTIEEVGNMFPYEWAFINPFLLADQIERDCCMNHIKLNIPQINEEFMFIQSITNKAKTNVKFSKEEYRIRFFKELEGICRNGYISVFDVLITATDFLKENNEHFMLRGAGNNSLIAYLLGISDIDPIEWNLPIETFLGENFEKVPDFDLSINPDIKERLTEYLVKVYGKDNVIHPGYISTFSDKQAVIMFSNYILSKDVGVTSEVKETKLFKLCDTAHTYGVHPGGILIKSNDSSYLDFTPLHMISDDGVPTTMNDFHNLNNTFIKFDFLGHINMKIIKMLEEKTNTSFEDTPINDEKVMSLFENNQALNKKDVLIENSNPFEGITDLGIMSTWAYIKMSGAKTIDQIVKISGLTHGIFATKEMTSFLKKSNLDKLFGCRDDIYNDIVKYLHDEKLAYKIQEDVRFGKGDKKETSLVFQKMAALGYISEDYKTLTEQVRYLFPKGHAVSSVLTALRFAYYKINYPKAFYESIINSYLIDNVEEEIFIKNSDELINVINDVNNKNYIDNSKVARLLIEIKERGYNYSIKNKQLIIEE